MLKDHLAPKTHEEGDDCNVFKQVELQGMEFGLIAYRF